MRTLIIPDVHNHTQNADHWLQTQHYDGVVFLGDYFDDFNDTPGDAINTARWLRARMDSHDDIFLLGNHDASYLFPDSPELECPGFTRQKSRVIHEILQSLHWGRFQLAHFEQGWLMSHAGFHPEWMMKPTVKTILARCKMAMSLAKSRVVDPILGAGKDRGGEQKIGGPLWMDWKSLIPILHINQLVGHTPDRAVREKHVAESMNYCIDVQNAAVAAILCDGKLTLLSKK